MRVMNYKKKKMNFKKKLGNEGVFLVQALVMMGIVAVGLALSLTQINFQNRNFGILFELQNRSVIINQTLALVESDPEMFPTVENQAGKLVTYIRCFDKKGVDTSKLSSNSDYSMVAVANPGVDPSGECPAYAAYEIQIEPDPLTDDHNVHVIISAQTDSTIKAERTKSYLVQR